MTGQALPKGCGWWDSVGALQLMRESVRRTPAQSQPQVSSMIRKLPSGEYRLFSRKKDRRTGKRRNLGTFKTRAAAVKHEREIQFFKHRA